MADREPKSDPNDRSEIVFLSLTRPQMLLGAPIEAVLGNSIGCFFLGMMLSSPHTIWRNPVFFWLAAIPIHMLLKRIAGWDFYGFRTLSLWMQTLGIGRRRLASISRDPPTKASEIASCV